MPRQRLRQYVLPIAEGIKINVEFLIVGGKARGFSITLLCLLDERWHSIKRCDMAHGLPHCHIKRLSGQNRRIIIGDKESNLGVLGSEIIDDFRKNYPRILDNYNS